MEPNNSDDQQSRFPNIPIPPHIREIGEKLRGMPPVVREQVLAEQRGNLDEMMRLLTKRNDTPELITNTDVQRMTEITEGIMQSFRRALGEIN